MAEAIGTVVVHRRTDDELVAAFYRYQLGIGNAPKTVELKAWAIAKFREYLGDRRLAAVARSDIEHWLEANPGWGASARGTFVSFLQTLYRFLQREGVVDANPAELVDRPKKRRPLARPIKTVDLATALSGAEPLELALLSLAAFAGLRAGEIAALRREDIHDASDPQVIVVRRGKGDKDRVVPLHPAAWAALTAYGLPATEGPIFRRSGGCVMSAPVVTKRGRDYLHRLGIKASLHKLRAWFATELYSQTHDLRLVQEMLGHSQPSTTVRYTSLDPAEAVTPVRSIRVPQCAGGDVPSTPSAAVRVPAVTAPPQRRLRALPSPSLDEPLPPARGTSPALRRPQTTLLDAASLGALSIIPADELEEYARTIVVGRDAMSLEDRLVLATAMSESVDAWLVGDQPPNELAIDQAGAPVEPTQKLVNQYAWLSEALLDWETARAFEAALPPSVLRRCRDRIRELDAGAGAGRAQ